MDETTTILVETRGNVGIITLNRPDILNAVNLVMLNEIAYQVETWEYDDNIRAIIIKGSDKAFAAGIDIKEMSQEVSQQSLALNAWYNEFSRIENCSKPIIAAVAGYALGLGCELALVSDIVLAADNARFGHPEISLGILPGFGACSRLTHTIGKAKTMEVILTGKALSAEEAMLSGLISRVVALPDLEEEALRVAMRIASLPFQAVLQAKETIKEVNEMSLQNGIELEAKSCKLSMNTAEFRDNLQKFIQKS